MKKNKKNKSNKKQKNKNIQITKWEISIIQKKEKQNQKNENSIFFTSKRTYQKIKQNPNSKCPKCKNLIEPEFQICRNFRICRICYNKIMEEQKEDLIDFFSRAKFKVNEIIENKLYLGNEESSFLKENLKKLGITNIIIIGYNLYKFYPNDFEYKQIEIDDNEHEEIIKYFIPIIIYIKNNIKNKFFIHCQAGISRSVTITIAIIMFFKKMNFKNAFNFVFSKKKILDLIMVLLNN